MSKASHLTIGGLAAGLPGLRVQGGAGTTVSGIAYDSRRVRPGDLFVAVPGSRDDGARFIGAARAAGAAAVLAREGMPDLAGPAILASDVRLAMGLIAARLFHHPDRALTMIGVTGTNGKTTFTYLLEAILRAAGMRPAVIGTINYRFGELIRPAPTTTPESVDLFAMLAEVLDLGATHAIMEISSHALDQKRVAGLCLRHAAFTNLTRDHLDYHHDFEDYYQAKRKLFTEVIAGAWSEAPPSPEPPRAAINQDDAYGQRLARELAGGGAATLTYSTKSDQAPVRALNAAITDRGIQAQVITPTGVMELSSPLVGRHNLENILAAVAVAHGLAIGPEAVTAGVAALDRVPGRLEPVPNRRGVTVLVDYAHTPDALEHVVSTCRELKRGRLITVFGCGGDRDPGKRPLMGKIAVTGSELAVVTSDNPRTEDPQVIITQILAGVKETGVPPYAKNGDHGWLVEPDRDAAIRRAIGLARPGDVVLIAGKGHEDYQILGTVKIHFDDREAAARALEEG